MKKSILEIEREVLTAKKSGVIHSYEWTQDASELYIRFPNWVEDEAMLRVIMYIRTNAKDIDFATYSLKHHQVIIFFK
jgi:hypothetical protein